MLRPTVLSTPTVSAPIAISEIAAAPVPSLIVFGAPTSTLSTSSAVDRIPSAGFLAAPSAAPLPTDPVTLGQISALVPPASGVELSTISTDLRSTLPHQMDAHSAVTPGDTGSCSTPAVEQPPAISGDLQSTLPFQITYDLPSPSPDDEVRELPPPSVGAAAAIPDPVPIISDLPPVSAPVPSLVPTPAPAPVSAPDTTPAPAPVTTAPVVAPVTQPQVSEQVKENGVQFVINGMCCSLFCDDVINT